uniref:Single stranded DNA binding protein 4 n=1 Tax=Sarcophilus harrisii TaxID=9305 RepID=G3W6J1_SARHA
MGKKHHVRRTAGVFTFVVVSAAAAPSPVLGNIPPNDGMPGGPIPPGFFQPPGGVPGTQPLLPNSMDPTRQQGHPNMGGSMQRMNPPRGMGPMGPGPQNYGSGMRPPPNSLGPAMPGINMGPGAGRPWPNPNSANSIPYSSSSPGTYVGPPGGGGPPGTPIMPSPAGNHGQCPGRASGDRAQRGSGVRAGDESDPPSLGFCLQGEFGRGRSWRRLLQRTPSTVSLGQS